MDAGSFLRRQDELRERLRHAVPRSARARQLQTALRDLVREELQREAGEPPAPMLPIPAPPPEFLARVGQVEEPRQAAAHYGGRRPWWIED